MNFTSNFAQQSAAVVYLNKHPVNQRNEFHFFGHDAGRLVSGFGEKVSGDGGHQAADNASGNKSGNVHKWVYVAIHEAFKIVLCGAIGGLIAAAIWHFATLFFKPNSASKNRPSKTPFPTA
jgi:hypothetical protein